MIDRSHARPITCQAKALKLLDLTNPEIVVLCLDIRAAVRAKADYNPLIERLRQLVPEAPPPTAHGNYRLARRAVYAAYVIMSEKEVRSLEG